MLRSFLDIQSVSEIDDGRMLLINGSTAIPNTLEARAEYGVAAWLAAPGNAIKQAPGSSA